MTSTGTSLFEKDFMGLTTRTGTLLPRWVSHANTPSSLSNVLVGRNRWANANEGTNPLSQAL